MVDGSVVERRLFNNLSGKNSYNSMEAVDESRTMIREVKRVEKYIENLRTICLATTTSA